MDPWRWPTEIFARLNAAQWDHEPSKAGRGTEASWSAAVLCRFWRGPAWRKPQRTGALQNLADQQAFVETFLKWNLFISVTVLLLLLI